MNIVFFNHYAGSPYYGMEFRPYYLAEEFIKLGHKVTIVAANNSHIRHINPTFGEKTWEEDIDGIHYFWIKTRQYKGNGLSRILNMMDYIRGLYCNIRKFVELKPDVVIASSTYPLDNYPVYKISKKTKAQFIYEVHDLWPLSPQILGGYSKFHPFIIIMQIAENFAYKHVDKVISLPPFTEKHMLEHGLKEGKFYNVNNGIYIPEVSFPEPLAKEFVELLPKDKIIIGYCGTLGKANVLNRLIDAAKIAETELPNVFFAIVGKGPEKQNLQNQITENQLSNIHIYDPIPKKQVQSFLKMMSINIILLNDNGLFSFGISLNKLYDYMYSGRPVLQSCDGIIPNNIVNESCCGITCSTEPHDIVNSLKKLLTMKSDELQKMGENGKNYVLKYYSYEVLAKKFIDAIEA